MRVRQLCWMPIVITLITCVACAVKSTASQSNIPITTVALAQGEGKQSESNQEKSQTEKRGEKTKNDDDKPLTAKIRIGKHIFELEVAADSASRAKGLMDRTELAEDEGMIFVYPTGTRTLSFWMKNCVIDIDVAFLNSRGRVVALHEMKAEEPRGEKESLFAYEQRLTLYRSKRAAQYAVELKSGTLKDLEVEVGDEIVFDRATLAKLARKNEKKERARDDAGLLVQ